MAKTRGVFGIVMDLEKRAILLGQRADGKGWEPCGGRVENDEDDRAALCREFMEEAEVEAEVLCQLGEPLPYKDDVCVAYCCRIVRGIPTPTTEVVRHCYCTMADLKAGYVIINDKPVALKLVGPDGRLGRMGRMVYDGFSLMQEPAVTPVTHGLIGLDDSVVVSRDNPCLLLWETDKNLLTYRRLDPYAADGYMQPPTQ